MAANPLGESITSEIQARHLPFGTIVGYTRCGDSAIWTGHYLAGESFRFEVTRDAAALANVRSLLVGKSLVDVT